MAPDRTPDDPPAWLADRPTLLGIVNLNPDSFSDPRAARDPDVAVEHARSLVAAGADAVDLGAQSGALAAQLVPPAVQAEMLAGAVAPLAAAGIAVSIDAFDPVPVERGLAAGAAIVNDYSGLADPRVAELTGAAGAWYVLTHNPVGPRARQTDPRFYDDVVGHVLEFHDRSLPLLAAAGVPSGRVLLDPGVDLGKTPAQSLDLLRGLDRLRANVDCGIFLAPSRKDVIGVLTRTRPADRGPGTLAILGAVAHHARTLVRVHDVAAARQYLDVTAAIAGVTDLAPDAILDDDLRRQG